MKLKEYAAEYDKRAVSQNQAGQILLEKIKNHTGNRKFTSIADVGCGSAGLSKTLYEFFEPDYMVGYDKSFDMIELAKKTDLAGKVKFIVSEAESIDESNAYDLIFSNSSFQWFYDQKKAILQMHSCLKDKGIAAIQSSAKHNWCPQFLRAIEPVSSDPVTSEAYLNYKFPVTHYDTESEYAELFMDAGFKVTYCEIITQNNKTTLDGAINIFRSGAVKAFLLQDYFSIPKPIGYDERFMHILKEGLKEQCDESGAITIEYPRVYILAER